MSNVRVRFAPSPSGFMHLGNVRTALFNYLFARQKNGTFIIRLEDTDPERNFDPNGEQIIKDLEWLGLTYDEGPLKSGPYAPYQQSLRTDLYTEYLHKLAEKKHVYKCFCTVEELEKKRQRQIALKQPPRYDRTCEKLSEAEIEQRISGNEPYIWRFKVDHNQTVTINDLAHKNMTFDMKNFSDFPLTRSNGTFTFIFANVIDDIVMKITHVFRGEDHLSNTANQAAIYLALNAQLPLFWHMPILCNTEGKKLSKRDFGFSLSDLKKAGYVHEAINNYLGIIGATFPDEFMDIATLTSQLNFNSINPTGAIKYDVEKLTWLNHKWIESFSAEQLLNYTRPFLLELYPQAAQHDDQFLKYFLQVIKSELPTLQHVHTAAAWFFDKPIVHKATYQEYVSDETLKKIAELIKKQLPHLNTSQLFLDNLKLDTQASGIKMKDLFVVIRLALTGTIKGPQIHAIIELLGTKEAHNRFANCLQLLNN